MARISSSLAAATLGAALVLGGLGTVAGPAAAAKKPPVTISGRTANEGVGKVRNGAVTIEADDFSFTKTYLKTKAGTVRVTVENDGDVDHTFTIDGQDVDEELAPDATATITIEVSADEPVVFYCRFHRGGGMQGALFTAESARAATTPKATTPGSGSGTSSYGY